MTRILMVSRKNQELFDGMGDLRFWYSFLVRISVYGFYQGSTDGRKMLEW
jgi:hypothetical protein